MKRISYIRLQLLLSLMMIFCLFGIANGQVEVPEEPIRQGLPATTESWNGLYLKLRLSDRIFGIRKIITEGATV